MLYLIGASPAPQFLFCLDAKKESKKVKTASTSLEKPTLESLKSSKLASANSGDSNKDDS